MKSKTAVLAALFAAAIAIGCLFLPSELPTAAKQSLFQSEYAMNIGESLQLEAPNGVSGAIEYTSDAPLIALVTGSGVVRAISPGAATVTIASGNEQYDVAVEVAGVPVRELALEAEEITVNRGERRALAVLMNEDATDRRVYWFTRDRSIATIDSDGVITAIAPGETAIICYTPSGLSASLWTTVRVETLSAVLKPTISEMSVGETVSLVLETEPADATDWVVDWLTSDASVCEVSPDGVVTAVGEGRAMVRARTEQGLYATAQVLVQ